MRIDPEEIVETLLMITQQSLDIRTVTLGLSLASCAHDDIDVMARRVYERVTSRRRAAGPRRPSNSKREFWHPHHQQAHLGDSHRTARRDVLGRRHHTHRVGARPGGPHVGVDFIGGFSALVHKGIGDGDRRLIASIPSALAATHRVCASANVATTRAGVNMDAVLSLAEMIVATAKATADHDSIGCAKLVVFANMVEDNPFMAGAVHGVGEPDEVINVGISGPGVVRAVVESLPDDADLTAVAEAIKATAFKITRAGELVAREAAKRLGVQMGIVDLSLAPTPGRRRQRRRHHRGDGR